MPHWPKSTDPPPAAPRIVYELEGAECLKCGYKWIPYKFPPKRCANCDDTNWWKPYVYNIKREGPGARPPRKTKHDLRLTMSLKSQVNQLRRKTTLQRMRRKARRARVTSLTVAAAERDDPRTRGQED